MQISTTNVLIWVSQIHIIAWIQCLYVEVNHYAQQITIAKNKGVLMLWAGYVYTENSDTMKTSLHLRPGGYFTNTLIKIGLYVKNYHFAVT